MGVALKNINSEKDSERIKERLFWMKEIQNSELSVREYFATHDVPFTRAQYYLFRKAIKKCGEVEALCDKVHRKGPRKLTPESKGFIERCLELDSSIGPTCIQKKLEEKYGIIMTVSGVFRAITRMGLKTTKRPKREQEEPVKEDL